jgi:hypothetical protein
MRMLAIINGEYGTRHVNNVIEHGPPFWEIEVWQAPALFPPMIDYPEDYLPENLSPANLILSFAEHRAVAELLPEAAKLTGATAVIAPVDNETWLPRGLARQLRGWLERDKVACVTPKPLCSLTESDYLITRRERMPYDNPLIAEFARYFGQPQFEVEVDPKTRNITAVHVKRDAVCGCARFTAEGLIGINADDAEEKAGLLHHHFPCMASMGIDPDFSDTLLHVSGNLMKDAVGEQVKPFKIVRYFKPGETAGDQPQD